MVDAGQACGPTAPCARMDNYCDPSSLICVTLPIEGQPCTGGGQCVQYAYCDAGTCQIRPAAGQACTAASGCQFTSFCPASGVCEAPTSPIVCP